MAQISGITLEKTPTGKPEKIIFSYPIWGILLQEMFIEKGLDFPIPTPNKQKSVTTKTASKEIAGIKKTPSGYLTHDEFWTIARENLNKMLSEDALL
ncbi:MAG: hypothetical protein LBN27_08945 [Prevotellaceae bacterium]|jgi:hypothetical protein|nr:hypothetical protein [Prevotellaceae bacterium]